MGAAPAASAASLAREYPAGTAMRATTSAGAKAARAGARSRFAATIAGIVRSEPFAEQALAPPPAAA